MVVGSDEQMMESVARYPRVPSAVAVLLEGLQVPGMPSNTGGFFLGIHPVLQYRVLFGRIGGETSPFLFSFYTVSARVILTHHSFHALFF